MATEAEDLEGIEGEEGAEGAAKGGGKKGLIIGIVLLLVLGGGGFAGWKMFGAKADGAEKKEEVVKLPPRYINLDPPFVVNFEAEAMVRFLQVTVGAMTRDLEIEKLIKDNDPRVRNDLLLILSNQTYASVSSVEGKEALRQKCLEAIRAVVKDTGGDPKKVEALYFTSFVMQ
jgi:flagellar FliL protein